MVKRKSSALGIKRRHTLCDNSLISLAKAKSETSEKEFFDNFLLHLFQLH